MLPSHLGSLGRPLLAGSVQPSLHLPLLQAPPQPAAVHHIYWPHLQLAVLHSQGHALSQQLATLCRHHHVLLKQPHLQLASLHMGCQMQTPPPHTPGHPHVQLAVLASHISQHSSP